MNLTFGLILFNSDYVLEPVLQSILPYGKVVAAAGSVSYYRERGFTTSTDDTNAILKQYDIPTVYGTWNEKDEECNAYVPLIPEDTDFLWMVDGDECLFPETIEGVLKELDNYDSVSLTPISFYGGFERYIGGFEQSFVWYRIQRWYAGARWATHRPPTVNAPDGLPWREHRHWNAPFSFAHYSYCFASQVKAKAAYYETRGGCIPDYFQNVWLRWVLGNDLTKQIIEDEFNGVQEWIPSRRGEARTRLYTGEHPQVIQAAMPRLRERFERELDAYR